MATFRPVELAPDAATARRSWAERSKLRRELGRLDAVCLLIAAIVVLDTLGAVARGGAQTLTWLAVVAALFFLPAGLVVAELGAAFPNQGGPYVWARLAFGRHAGSLVALAYFLETPVWVGGSLAITAVAVVDRLVLPLDSGWRVPVALAFVWTTVALAVVPLRAGKRFPLPAPSPRSGCSHSSPRPWPPTPSATASMPPRPATWPPPGPCSPWSPPCWSTTSSASSCPRRPARSCATRPATSRPRSSAPAP